MRYMLVLIFTLCATIVQAQSLKLLEIEIQLREDLEKVRVETDDKVRGTLEKTTLWKKYLEAREILDRELERAPVGKCRIFARHYENQPWVIIKRHYIDRYCVNWGRYQYEDVLVLHRQLMNMRKRHASKLYRETARKKLRALKKEAKSHIQELLKKEAESRQQELLKKKQGAFL